MATAKVDIDKDKLIAAWAAAVDFSETALME